MRLVVVDVVGGLVRESVPVFVFDTLGQGELDKQATHNEA
jgi:hypothetical protein